MPRMQQGGNGQARPSRRAANGQRGQRPSAQASQRMPRVEGQRPSAAQRQQRPVRRGAAASQPSQSMRAQAAQPQQGQPSQEIPVVQNMRGNDPSAYSRAKYQRTKEGAQKASPTNASTYQAARYLGNNNYAPKQKADFFTRGSLIAVAVVVVLIVAGIFAFNRAFRFEQREGDLTFLPIRNMDNVVLSDLVGYEMQKQLLIDNTRAFVEGRSANNVLLYGDSGTGKSTSIKAIVNEFYQDGLRMVEIYRHQFKDLSALIARLKLRSHRFIIYMDDLSFEDFETDYKFLKAVIEGGVETRPENILIYATSNRRHLVKETFDDGSDKHSNDTVQERISLSERFGITITYSRPQKNLYLEIVHALAEQNGLDITTDCVVLAVIAVVFAGLLLVGFRKRAKKEQESEVEVSEKAVSGTPVQA